MQQPLAIRRRLSRLPLRMLLVIAVLLIIAAIAAPMIDRMSDKDKADNVLVTGVPFILIFVAIVLAFAFLIVLVARLLNHSIPFRIHQTIEWIIIGGVVVGVIGMFQPWVLAGYQVGFLLLFGCLLAFNVWTHVTPKRLPQTQKVE